VIGRARTACLDGLDALAVDVEADVSAGLPSLTVVGLTDRAIQEARERVRSAVRNSGFAFPARKVIVNLAPAGVRKEGSSFDLAFSKLRPLWKNAPSATPLSTFASPATAWALASASSARRRTAAS
jgi:magnesium chelatase family protein